MICSYSYSSYGFESFENMNLHLNLKIRNSVDEARKASKVPEALNVVARCVSAQKIESLLRPFRQVLLVLECPDGSRYIYIYDALPEKSYGLYGTSA